MPVADRPLTWQVPGRLAFGARPLRWVDAGPLEASDRSLVIEWVEAVLGEGIRGVLCLLEDMHLSLYQKPVPEGLIALYRDHGLTVEHRPIADPAHPSGAAGVDRLANLGDAPEAVVSAYRRLPEPVLVHCSAGIDRSPLVARIIAERL